MHRYKNRLSILLVFVFTFSMIIMPAVAQAAPNLSPPSLPSLPGVNPSNYRQMEAPSTISGVNYRFNPKVINMPDMPYSVEDIPKSETEGGGTGLAPSISAPGGIGVPGAGINLPAVGSAASQAAAGQELPYNAKNLVLKPGASLNPKIGDIYFDRETNKAFKVAGNASADASGNKLVPFVEPGIEEVVEQFYVPHQTIPLTEGNIDFENMPEGVEYVGKEGKASGSIPHSYMASSLPLPGGLNVDRQGNTYIFKLKDFVIYEYPKPKESGSGDEEKPNDGGEAEEGYNWSGVEDTSKLGVKIKVSDGTIKITDPKINFDASWDLLYNPFAKAHCEIDMDIDADVNIEGNIKFKEERWQQIYGYFVCDNQSDPKVKVYIGVFAVVTLEGELKFKVKVTQVGHLNSGIDVYPASFATGVPIVIPTGDFDSYERQVGIVIDGNITAAAGVMAGLGVEIFGFDILELQIRLGLEGNCTFHIEAGDTANIEGGGNAPPGGASASATFKLYFYVYVDVYYIGNQKRLFEFKPLLVDKTWSGTIGSGGSAGAGSEGVGKIPGRADVFIDKADAFENVVEGHVLIGDMPDQRPCNANVRIHVKLYDWLGNDIGIRTYDTTAGSNGKFYLNVPLSPFDFVSAQARYETEMELYRASTKSMQTTVPFSLIEFEPDAFNDRVYGTVSGGYTGPILIFVNSPGKSTQFYTTNVTSGEFSLPVSLTGGDTVNILLSFENKDVWAQEDFEPANIDALDNTLALDSASTVTKGVIQNTKGDTPYTGDVKLRIERVIGLVSNPVLQNVYEKTIKALPLVNQSSITVPQAPNHISGGNISSIYEDLKSSTGYTFDNTPIPKLNMNYYVTIEHDGITKTCLVTTVTEKDVSHWERHGFEEDVKSPVKQWSDPVINPVDNIFEGVMSGVNVMNIPMNVIHQGQQQAAMQMNMPVYKPELKAEGGNGFIKLEWNSAPSQNVKGYNLYRGTSAGKYEAVPITIDAIDGNSYIDSNVQNGINYYYIVKTVFKDNTESAPSNEVMAAPVSSGKTPLIPPPSVKPPIKPPVLPPPR